MWVQKGRVWRFGNGRLDSTAVSFRRLSVEMLRRIQVETLGIRPTVSVQIGDVALNDLRVPTKHLGRLPRFQDVLDLSKRIKPVFHENANNYLGVPFDAVRLAASISHEDTRRRVEFGRDRD